MARVVEFRCPHCSQYYRVSSADAGRSASCTSCSGAMEVPRRSARVTRAERWSASKRQHLVAAGALGGSDDSFARGFAFVKRSLQIAVDYKASMLPIAIAVLFSICFAILAMFTMDRSGEIGYVDLGVILFPQYLVFYFCMGMTIRMVFGYLIGERVTFGQAFAAAMIRLPNIILMAIIGTLFDLLAEWARRDRSFVAQIGASIIEAIWTMASFLLMPAIIIDGLTFTQGLAKTKDAFKRNLIPIGIGEVAVRSVTFLVSLVASVLLIGLAAMTGSFPVVIVAFVLWAVVVGVFSVYVRTVYYTCLYVWTVSTEEAEAHGGRVWVPRPLAEALA